MSAELITGRVLTCLNYWDRPRQGIAIFNGIPHIYHCPLDENGDYSAYYYLIPVSKETLDLMLESWDIWIRWRTAFDEEKLGPDDEHPCLAVDKVRKEELDRLIPKLEFDPEKAVKTTAIFTPRGSRPETVEFKFIERGCQYNDFLESVNATTKSLYTTGPSNDLQDTEIITP